MKTEKEIADSIIVPVYRSKNVATGEISEIGDPDKYHIAYLPQAEEWFIYDPDDPEKILGYADNKNDAELSLNEDVTEDDPDTMVIVVLPDVHKLQEFEEWAKLQKTISPADIEQTFGVNKEHANECIRYLEEYGIILTKEECEYYDPERDDLYDSSPIIGPRF